MRKVNELLIFLTQNLVELPKLAWDDAVAQVDLELVILLFQPPESQVCTTRSGIRN